VDRVETTLTCSVEVVQHWWTEVRAVWVAEGAEPPTMPAGFHVLPRRWVVERHVCMAGAIPAPEQGLRSTARHGRSVDLPGHDPADARPNGPIMVFQIPSNGCIRQVRCETCAVPDGLPCLRAGFQPGDNQREGLTGCTSNAGEPKMPRWRGLDTGRCG
jgi:hypothetical protein